SRRLRGRCCTSSTIRSPSAPTSRTSTGIRTSELGSGRSAKAELLAAQSHRFGVVFSGDFPLQRTLDGAVLAEQLGFHTCWLGEDFFYHGGIAVATAVAERTERIGIGLGVLSPLPRHPAPTAME